MAAWCLSLEYGISGSAVARSWGDKVNAYIASLYAAQIESVSGTDITKQLHTFWNPFSPGYGVNVFAGLLQVAVVLILLAGVDIGKFAVNTFTIVKIILVLFMIVTGLALFQPSNLSSASAWAPKGMSGILRGATSSFFGFVGYDEVSILIKMDFFCVTRLVHRRLCQCFTVQVVFRPASYSIMSIEITINYFISIVNFKVVVVRLGNYIAVEPYKIIAILHI